MFAAMNNVEALRQLLGPDFISANTSEERRDNSQEICLMNSRDITCRCKTVILREKHGTLIVPTESMAKIEDELKYLKHSDEFFSNLKQGCYWLVDDMYKFEQMGYTKEIDAAKQRTQQQPQLQPQQATSGHESAKTIESDQQKTNSQSTLRYLLCADCNLCPLGWFDVTSSESYLYVWPEST